MVRWTANSPGKNFIMVFGPLLPGFHYAAFNDIKASRENAGPETIMQQLSLSRSREKAAFIRQTPEFFIVPERSMLPKHDIVLIFDEIQCGMGRTGTLWKLRAVWRNTGHNDTGKALLAVGCRLERLFVVTGSLVQMSPGSHGSTFGGNPVACAMGCEILSIIADASFFCSR